MYCIGQTNKGYWSNKSIKSHSLTVVRLYKKFRQKQYSISVYRVLILCCTIVVLFSFVFGEIALIWLYLMFNASYNFRPFAMPKIIGLGANLTKLWQKLFCLVFLRHDVLFRALYFMQETTSFGNINLMFKIMFGFVSSNLFTYGVDHGADYAAGRFMNQWVHAIHCDCREISNMTDV